VLVAIVSLLIAVVILRYSVRMLQEYFHPPEEKRGRFRGCRGSVRAIFYLGGVALWFSAGSLALALSVQKFAERIILALQ
jgi:hypothetical protein